MNQKHTFTDDMVLRCLEPGEENSVQFLDEIPEEVQRELDGLRDYLIKHYGSQKNPNNLTLSRFLFRVFLEVPTQRYQGIFLDESQGKFFMTDPLIWNHGLPYSVVSNELTQLSEGRFGHLLRPPDPADNF